jgi:hypothetical protein
MSTALHCPGCHVTSKAAAAAAAAPGASYACNGLGRKSQGTQVKLLPWIAYTFTSHVLQWSKIATVQQKMWSPNAESALQLAQHNRRTAVPASTAPLHSFWHAQLPWLKPLVLTASATSPHQLLFTGHHCHHQLKAQQSSPMMLCM